MSELLPCPFCGKQPHSRWNSANGPEDDAGYWGIECCGAFVHEDDEETATKLWNTRAPSVSVAQQPMTTCRDCGTDEPCDEKCPNYIEAAKPTAGHEHLLHLVRNLRAHRIMCDGGNGNVYDIADEDCERAADFIELTVMRQQAATVTEGDPRQPVAASLVEALESIRLYANDTLSGRVDGPDDREWQRAAVIEIRNRARAALTAARDTEGKGKEQIRPHIREGEIDNLLSRLDQGAAHQGYPEGFGFSWTRLASDAATAIRRLRSQLSQHSSTHSLKQEG